MHKSEGFSIEHEGGQTVSRIILEFMRHGKKEKVEGRDDYDIRLIPEARKAASEKGRLLGVQADVAVAYGSPRKRSQEAAVRVMLGGRLEITDGMSVEEIEEAVADYIKLGEGSGKGKKLVVDIRLNIIDETKEGIEADAAGRYFDYVVESSDSVVAREKDVKSNSYTRTAGNIAEIVSKWVGVGKNFNKIVERKPEKYAEFKNQLERYFGSHQGVLECFLLKAIEKVQGVKERDEVLALMPAGFKELQGFRIDIENRGGDAQVISLDAEVEGKKINLELTPEILAEMVDERDVYNRQFEEQG